MDTVFISYSEGDSAIAEQVALHLEGNGYSTWFYHRDSIPGPTHLETTYGKIDQSIAVVVLISFSALGSDFVFPEILHAIASSRRTIPILVDMTYADLQRDRPRWIEALGMATAVEWRLGQARALSIVMEGLRHGKSPTRFDPAETAKVLSATTEEFSATRSRDVSRIADSFRHFSVLPTRKYLSSVLSVLHSEIEDRVPACRDLRDKLEELGESLDQQNLDQKSGQSGTLFGAFFALA